MKWAAPVLHGARTNADKTIQLQSIRINQRIRAKEVRVVLASTSEQLGVMKLQDALRKAMELGLIDGITDMRSKMRELYGDKVKLRVIPAGGTGLLGRLRRMPSIAVGANDLKFQLADDIVSTLEARALWARYGL